MMFRYLNFYLYNKTFILQSNILKPSYMYISYLNLYEKAIIRFGHPKESI